MGKDVEWKSFFQDNHRYADIINGIGCSGVQFVKDTDLQEVDTSSKKKSRDILRRVALEIVTKYTNSKELVKAKDYQIEGGKNDVCKAIRDLMDDSREKGREEGRIDALIETAKNLLDVLSDEEIAKRVSLPLEQVHGLRKEMI